MGAFPPMASRSRSGEFDRENGGYKSGPYENSRKLHAERDERLLRRRLARPRERLAFVVGVVVIFLLALAFAYQQG